MKTNVELRGFAKYLSQKMNAENWAALSHELNISKRMLTFLLREPKRFTISQIKAISDLSGLSIDEISSQIN